LYLYVCLTFSRFVLFSIMSGQVKACGGEEKWSVGSGISVTHSSSPFCVRKRFLSLLSRCSHRRWCSWFMFRPDPCCSGWTGLPGANIDARTFLKGGISSINHLFDLLCICHEFSMSHFSYLIVGIRQVMSSDWSAWSGLSTRVRICVRIAIRFRARFVRKQNRDPILFLPPITIVCLHISAKKIKNYLAGHLGQQIVHRIVWRFVWEIAHVDSPIASPGDCSRYVQVPGFVRVKSMLHQEHMSKARDTCIQGHLENKIDQHEQEAVLNKVTLGLQSCPLRKYIIQKVCCRAATLPVGSVHHIFFRDIRFWPFSWAQYIEFLVYSSARLRRSNSFFTWARQLRHYFELNANLIFLTNPQTGFYGPFPCLSWAVKSRFCRKKKECGDTDGTAFLLVTFSLSAIPNAHHVPL
jgi:hypothetical protein